MRLRSLFESVVGKKVIAAVTGAMMLLFLVGHVAGNLKVFLADPEPGVADIDAYGAFLRTVGEPAIPNGAVLWTVRIVLFLAVVLHVVCVVQLARHNRAARPVGYRETNYERATRPARWMMVSGLAVLGFIIFHILHFTTGSIEPSTFRDGAIYSNLYAAFTRWPFVVLYVMAMAFIAMHLYHGAWSMFQSLGLDNPDRNRGLRALALVLSIGLFAGFTTVPFSFALGAMESRDEAAAVPVPAETGPPGTMADADEVEVDPSDPMTGGDE